jgi:hypothetical protein
MPGDPRQIESESRGFARLLARRDDCIFMVKNGKIALPVQGDKLSKYEADTYS